MPLLRFAALGLSAMVLAGCGDDTPAPSNPVPDAGLPDSGGDASDEDAGDGGPPPVCGSGNRALPDGLVEIAWDDGKAFSSLRDQGFAITVDGTEFVLNEEILHEAVRFDLEHPARVHGFSVQWADLPAGVEGTTEIAAGLYPDFGHNGFDFWEPEPYWSGTRCLEDHVDGEWLTYVFDEPIVLEHPGLVYVAHRVDPAAVPKPPVFAFDELPTDNGDCAEWDECHSSINLPDAKKSSYYNGVSFPFQYDYLVRLHVEYTEQVAPEEKVFTAQTFTPTSHVSFGDWNNDGWDDMVTDGPKLWRNLGDGTFEDATAASGIAAMGVSATGGVFGDYDNDGCLDLFLYAEAYTVGDSLLHSSCDGTFTNATPASGIVDPTDNSCGDPVNNLHAPSAAAAFLDIDADGLLDIYVADFICWTNYTYYVDRVWHNLGGGVFEDWTAQHGFSASKTASRGAAPIDHDGDGDVDLFVNNYVLQANLFFDNQGDGTVVEKAIAKNVAGHKDQLYYGHTIGAAWGDLDNDGDFDLVSANLAHPRFFDFSDKTEVLLQDKDGLFSDLAGAWQKPVSAAGLRYQETHSVPALADFDLDGVLDLVITAVYDGRPTDFYWGNGDGTFRLDAYRSGIGTENGWGAGVSDFDNDGDPDLFAHVPYVNAKGPKAGNHWLQVRVVGNLSSNWAALGSTVEVVASGKTFTRHVQGGTGKGGQDSMYLAFGLRDAAVVEEIRVNFPGNVGVLYPGPHPIDARIWVFEDGTSAVGWAPP